LLQKLLNIFRIPDLRNKLLFTLGLLCVYRVGFHVPLPGLNGPAIRARLSEGSANDLFAQLSNYLSVFSGGGDLQQGTLFGLGIMPYISASIIVQLAGTFIPAVEKLRKEGEPGVRKINEWTRYLAVIVSIIQSFFYVLHFNTVGGHSDLYGYITDGRVLQFMILSVAMLTAGSVFLMWLGEQIDHFGIGNGISLIITAGIVSRIPVALADLIRYSLTNTTRNMKAPWYSWEYISAFCSDIVSPASVDGKYLSIIHIAFLAACFVFVVGAAILLTQAQRRITVQQAKQMRGRRVFGGSKQYLPLRVNHSGVMPVVFAQTIISLPMMGIQRLADSNFQGWIGAFFHFVYDTFRDGTYMHQVLYCAMIFFFAYFWNTVQFQPKEMANQLRDYGSFIPGFRPGKRTADYLEDVMARITYVGAAFLCVIAIIPSVIASQMLSSLPINDAWQISQFLGGTGLLIVISVMLDFVNRIEANLVMRNYGGFMDDSGPGSSAKNKRPKGSPSRGPQQPEPAYKSDNPRGLPA
jgi:preprotein translocase subunit SecY